MQSFFSLQGKKALITGGGSGIGHDLAVRFIQAGAKVIITDIKDYSVKAEAMGAEFIRMDVSDHASVKDGFEAAEKKMGKLDIVVNNAGTGALPGTIVEGDPEVWKRILEINVVGVMHGMKHAPAHMNSGGSIINTASQAAYTKIPGMEPYGASKLAVISITQSGALELADCKIRVNAVCPSNTKTPMMTEAEDAAYAEQMSKIMSPLGRAAETSDLVGVYHFLASKEAGYINGQAIVVDGGWSAGISGELLGKVIDQA